jgi:hypothetical protein
MNLKISSILRTAVIATALSLVATVAVAADPSPPAQQSAKPAPADAKPVPHRSPYAKAAREDAEAANGIIDKLQPDGKLATARKAIPRDQAKAGASHAKSVQKHAAH